MSRTCRPPGILACTTRRFYERFKTEHAAFLKFINGIPSTDERESYASLMLNRLMFVYFIQKNEFLDGDTDYLRKSRRKHSERPMSSPPSDVSYLDNQDSTYRCR